MFLEPADMSSGGGADSTAEQQRVDAIVARGPGGAFALAGAGVAVVMAIWLAFYFMVYVARGGGN